jgi:hypothetical protein
LHIEFEFAEEYIDSYLPVHFVLCYSSSWQASYNGQGKKNSNYKWTIFVIVAKLSNRHTTSQTKQNISLIASAQPYIDIFITNYYVYGLDYYRDGEFGWHKEPDTLVNRYIKDSKIYS